MGVVGDARTSRGVVCPQQGWDVHLVACAAVACTSDGLPEKASIHNVLVVQLVVQRQCRAFCALLPAVLLHRSEVLTSLRLPSHVGAEFRAALDGVRGWIAQSSYSIFCGRPRGPCVNGGRSRRSSSTNTSLRVPAERRRGPRCSSEQLGPSAFGSPTREQLGPSAFGSPTPSNRPNWTRGRGWRNRRVTLGQQGQCYLVTGFKGTLYAPPRRVINGIWAEQEQVQLGRWDRRAMARSISHL